MKERRPCMRDELCIRQQKSIEPFIWSDLDTNIEYCDSINIKMFA